VKELIEVETYMLFLLFLMIGATLEAACVLFFMYLRYKKWGVADHVRSHQQRSHVRQICFVITVKNKKQNGEKS